MLGHEIGHILNMPDAEFRDKIICGVATTREFADFINGGVRSMPDDKRKKLIQHYRDVGIQIPNNSESELLGAVLAVLTRIEMYAK
ncbi:hypothetical protein IJ135_00485 [Candidatus Saccharibacteria bacterium]|nr:hypothetical protein [Candidatus Saccharibacteria bacterium]